jgi:hypothetical protein
MRTLTLIASFVSMISGTIAAWYWYKSSKVRWRGATLEIVTKNSFDPKSLQAYILHLMANITHAALLNTRAAIWSGIAVVSSAVSGFLGTLGSN